MIKAKSIFTAAIRDMVFLFNCRSARRIFGVTWTPNESASLIVVTRTTYLIRKILKTKGVSTIKYSSILSRSSFSRTKFQTSMLATKALMR
jgi:hypothetical protein